MISLSQLLPKLRDRALSGTMIRDEAGRYVYGAPVGRFRVILTSRQEQVGSDYRLEIWDHDKEACLLKIKAEGERIFLERVPMELPALRHTPQIPRDDHWKDYCHALQKRFEL